MNPQKETNTQKALQIIDDCLDDIAFYQVNGERLHSESSLIDRLQLSLSRVYNLLDFGYADDQTELAEQAELDFENSSFEPIGFSYEEEENH